jgi:integrase
MKNEVRVPKYRLHKPSGRAVVTLGHRVVYLGKHGTADSRREYKRLTGEWMASAGNMPSPQNDTTVAELCAGYLKYAQSYYRKDGKPTGSMTRVKIVLRLLNSLYGRTFAKDFGPLALQSLQFQLAGSEKSRTYTNHLIDQVRRVFRWGVSRELIPPSVDQALQTVPGLRKGRTVAREPAPVLPVSMTVVEATMPFLPPVVVDMVKLQLLCGCRPGEICQLRPCDLDRTKETWAFRPQSHKTQHHGRDRVIFLGPQAREILTPYLLRDPQAYCFTPEDSERKRRQAAHEKRRVPVSYGNIPGSNCVAKPKRKAGLQFNTNSYSNCIRRASDRADAAAHKADPKACKKKRLVPRWTPNMLRHAKASEIRKLYGLEGAQVVLGHAHARVSEVYAERDLDKAESIMARIG